MVLRRYSCGLLLLVCSYLKGQRPDVSPANATPVIAPPSVVVKWKFFIRETLNPVLVFGVIPGATISQLTNSAPQYGERFWRDQAYLKRIGAVTGDVVSQNFFSDFMLASAFHEDTRYVRQGPGRHGKFWRVGYALSRSVITRTDSGRTTFDWANVIGCAMSAGLSNAYYPPDSRTRSETLTNWGTDIVGSGLSNLLPEFGPGAGRFFKRHFVHHQP